MQLLHHDRIREREDREAPQDVLWQAQEANNPPEREIRQRAHEIYLERLRTGTPGDAHSDWLIAEGQLLLFKRTGMM
jgi:hypothetical protein